jgi:hypothetical protein
MINVFAKLTEENVILFCKLRNEEKRSVRSILL